MLGDVGSGELFLILFVVFIVFGPKRLPEIGRALGKGISQFKSGLKDVQDEVSGSVDSRSSRNPES